MRNVFDKVVTDGMCINLQILRASHFVLKTFDEAYREFGIRATQLPVLSIIAQHGPVAIKTIAEALESERSVIFRKLKVMEKSGWIAEDPATSGKEKTYVLTDEGKQLIESMRPVRQQVQAHLLARLSPEEQNLMLTLCSKLQSDH